MKKMILGSCQFYCLADVKVIVIIILLEASSEKRNDISSDTGGLIQGAHICSLQEGWQEKAQHVDSEVSHS